MNCKNHSDRLAVTLCSRCGAPICAECSVSLDGKDICKSCVNSYAHHGTMTSPPPPPPVAPKPYHRHSTGFSGFWSFLFSFFPGAGHMYMGFMKKGLFYMSATLALVFLMSVCDYRIQFFFALSMGVVWCVQFFDVISIKRRLRAGIVVDDNIDEFLNFVGAHKAKILLGLVVVGVFSLVGSFSGILNSFGIYSGNRLFGSQLVPLLIIFGIILICFRRKK